MEGKGDETFELSVGGSFFSLGWDGWRCARERRKMRASSRASTTWQKQRNGGGKAQTDGGPSQSISNCFARRSRRGEDRIVPSLTKTRFPEEHVDGEGGEHGSALRKSLLHVKSSCARGIQSEHVGLPQEILRFAKISIEIKFKMLDRRARSVDDQ